MAAMGDDPAPGPDPMSRDSIPIIVGDHVRVVSGIAEGRAGYVRRTQRQRKGERKAIFWVEIAPGEEHAFFREELTWTGEVYVAAKAPTR